MTHIAVWMGYILIIAANVVFIFRNQLVMDFTPTDVIILLVNGAICILIGNEREKEVKE